MVLLAARGSDRTGTGRRLRTRRTCVSYTMRTCGFHHGIPKYPENDALIRYGSEPGPAHPAPLDCPESVVPGRFLQHRCLACGTHREIKEDQDAGEPDGRGQIGCVALVARDARGPARVAHLPGRPGLARALGQAGAAGRGRGHRHAQERALAGGARSRGVPGWRSPPCRDGPRRAHDADGLPRRVGRPHCPAPSSGLGTVGLDLRARTPDRRALGWPWPRPWSSARWDSSSRKLRQAGNDGPLGLFTTLALYAAWRRLHGVTPGAPAARSTSPVTSSPGRRSWTLALPRRHGPGVPLQGADHRAHRRRDGRSLPGDDRPTEDRLDGSLPALRGWLLFLVLALCWPVPVLLNDPHALGSGPPRSARRRESCAIPHQERTSPRPGIARCWRCPGRGGAGRARPALPPEPRRQAAVDGLRGLVPLVVGGRQPGGVFSSWAVAKPNYYVPVPAGPGPAGGHGLDPPEPRRSGSLTGRPRLAWQGACCGSSGLSCSSRDRGCRSWVGSRPARPAIRAGSWSSAARGSAASSAGAWIWRRGDDVLALAAGHGGAAPSPW